MWAILLSSALLFYPTISTVKSEGFDKADDELAIRPFRDFDCFTNATTKINSANLNKGEAQDFKPELYYFDKGVENHQNEDNWFTIEGTIIDKPKYRLGLYSKVALQVQLNDPSRTIVGQYMNVFKCEMYVKVGDGKEVTVQTPPSSEATSLIKEFHQVLINDPLRKNNPPRVAVIEFKEPVEMFWINFKIPKETLEIMTEAAAKRNQQEQTQFYIIMSVISSKNRCFYNQFSNLLKIPATAPAKSSESVVPWPKCIDPSLKHELRIEGERKKPLIYQGTLSPEAKKEADEYRKILEETRKKNAADLSKEYDKAKLKGVTVPKGLKDLIGVQTADFKKKEEEANDIMAIRPPEGACNKGKQTMQAKLNDPSTSTAKIEVFYTPFPGWVNVKIDMPPNTNFHIKKAFVQAHNADTGSPIGRFSHHYPCKPTAEQGAKSQTKSHEQSFIEKVTFLQYSSNANNNAKKPTVVIVDIKSPFTPSFVITLHVPADIKEIFVVATIITKEGQCLINQISPIYDTKNHPLDLDTKGTPKDMPFECDSKTIIAKESTSKKPNPTVDKEAMKHLRSLTPTNYKNVGEAAMDGKLKDNYHLFKNPPKPPPVKITTPAPPTEPPKPKLWPEFCSKPGYMQSGGLCSSATDSIDITQTLAFKFSKMPFPEDLWLHIDIYNKPNVPEVILISQIAIMLVNMHGEQIGEFAEHIPCKQDHKVFNSKHQFSEVKEVIDPDLTSRPIGLEIIKCTKGYGSGMSATPVTQAFLSFKPIAVPAFYFHYKFSEAEMQSMTEGVKPPGGFQMILLILDSNGRCYTPFVSKKLTLAKRQKGDYSKPIKNMPIDCHKGEGVMPIGGKVGDDMVLPKSDPDYKKVIQFTSNHPIPRRPDVPPDVGGPAGKLIDKYNDDKYNVKATTAIPLNVVELRTFKTKPTQKLDPSNFGAAPAPPQNIEKKRNPRQELYLECFHTRGCIGEPVGCVETKSCQSIVSYVKENDDWVRFEMLGASLKYVAVGLSRDVKMGDDSVVECVREANNEIRAYQSWNYNDQKQGKRNLRLKKHDDIKDVYGTFEDGVIYCTFLRKKYTMFHGHEFNLETEKFFILSVSGSTAIDGPQGNIEIHDRVVVAKDNVIIFSHVGKSPNQLIIDSIHGVSMILVWTFLVPITTFITRYFKETFLNVSILKKYSLWFGLHVICMSLAVFLTFFTVILIYAAGNRFPGANGWNFHAVCGIAMLCLMALQVPLALGIIKYNRMYKYLFLNFIHGFDGHFLFFLGFACMFKSRYMRDGLPCETDSSLIAWIVTYFIIHLCMSYQVCYSDFVQGRHVSRTYTLGPLDIPDITEEGKEEPGALGRKIFLVLFLFFAIIFAVIITIEYMTGQMLDCAEAEVVQKHRAQRVLDV